MGGKTATSTQQVSVPPQVLAQYQAVNQFANQVSTEQVPVTTQQPVYAIGPNGYPMPTGQTHDVTTYQTELKPFQEYGGEFVAPVNEEQTSGINATNAVSGEAQPFYQAATQTLGNAQAGVNPTNELATGLAAASAQQVNPSDLDAAAINKYISPYLQDVVGSEAQLLNQNNQQQQAGQLGNAIRSGAFGGDRTGIAAANLEQQQNLANANIYSNLLNTGYNTALTTAQQQQGVGLAAGQANRAALGQAAQTLSGVGQTAYGEGANTAAELGSLGSGAQSAGLQGAQAQIAAGTVQQQTQQAQDTAKYQQFLQQQSYPFQVAQFLANIAEGTGSLSGSTTTTQQPGGFFSDERLKEDMEPIGKTFDGQPIYRYKLKGDSRERIGLSAQQVEKKHPEAVGLAGGFRFVDYGKATDDAANRGHMYSGGVARASLSERRAYAYGGGPDEEGGLGAVLTAQRNMYASNGNQNQRNIPSQGVSHQLAVAPGTPAPPAQSGMSRVNQGVGLGKDIYKGYKWATKPDTPSVVGHTPNPSSAPSSTANGVTTNFETGDVPGATTNFEAAEPGTTTTFDAGLGAADTSTAATAGDAAATGASGAAEGAAASGAAEAGAGTAAAGAAEAGAGAAAGAATGAVAAGAADAAATEAAALAAEYAAAYAAAAAAAAKRGGRIVRKKYAYGGLPYEDPDSELDIPDEEVANAKLQSPGPLVKQPTGLQTAQKMGDPNQANTLGGEILSNQALARGGLARAGYDDGGAADEGSAPEPSAEDIAPEIASDADRGAGVVPSKKSSIWRALKKPENYVPILSALGAMGTAPTRSFGTALAAGLGAGAKSYLDTQESLATAGETREKARAIDIANQLSTMKVKAARDYLNAPPTTTPPVDPYESASSPPSGENAAEKMDAYYRKKYFVQPWLPSEQEAQRKARGAAIAGIEQPLQQVEAARNQRIQNQTAQNQSAAQHEADALYAKATDPSASDQEKQAAMVAYNAIHQWAGDTYVDMGGVKTNSRTGAPAIGVAAQQLSPQSWVSMMNEANRLVEVPQSDGTLVQMPNWQAHHASSAEAYARQLTNAAPPPPPSTAVNAPAAPSRSPVRSGAAPNIANSPSVTQGITQSPIALKQQQINLEALEHVREAGDQAPNNRSINQQLLQLSAETATGPATAAVQKIAAALGLPSGSRYQEINAYLDRQAASQAMAMGVPHTNAGLAASQTATGTTEYTPQALQEKVKYADALNSGTMAYREGLDKAVGTGSHQDLTKYQAFRSAWAKNFDPDVYRADDALRRGDTAELNAIRARLGPKGMKVLAKKSANLRMLENGQIPQ